MGFFKSKSLLGCPNYNDIFLFLMVVYRSFNKKNLNDIMKLLKTGCETVGYNFNDLSFVAHGNDSIVFENGEYIFKVMECEYNVSVTDYISHCNYILKPLYEEGLNIQNKNIRVFVFDKLDVSNINFDDVVLMSILLRKDGYLWYDPKPQNIGKDSNGNLFLIDFGQVYYIADRSIGYKKAMLADYCFNFPEFNQAYIDTLNDFCGKRK